MTKNDFREQQIQAQIAWRRDNISKREHGDYNGRKYEHIVPRPIWEETLWHGIKYELPTYLNCKNIQSHTGTNNLLSSWIVCANLYYIVRINPGFRKLMLGFLQKHISAKITGIKDWEQYIEIDPKFYRPNDVNYLLGDYSKAKKVLGWQPKVSFSDMVKLMVKSDLELVGKNIR